MNPHSREGLSTHALRGVLPKDATKYSQIKTYDIVFDSFWVVLRRGQYSRTHHPRYQTPCRPLWSDSQRRAARVSQHAICRSVVNSHTQILKFDSCASHRAVARTWSDLFHGRVREPRERHKGAPTWHHVRSAATSMTARWRLSSTGVPSASTASSAQSTDWRPAADMAAVTSSDSVFAPTTPASAAIIACVNMTRHRPLVDDPSRPARSPSPAVPDSLRRTRCLWRPDPQRTGHWQWRSRDPAVHFVSIFHGDCCMTAIA